MFCRPFGSSPAGVLFMSPVPVKKALQVLSSDKLWPSEVIVPANRQFPPMLSATIVFFSVAVPPVGTKMPPPMSEEESLS